jgi:hypothetical protein
VSRPDRRDSPHLFGLGLKEMLAVVVIRPAPIIALPLFLCSLFGKRQLHACQYGSAWCPFGSLHRRCNKGAVEVSVAPLATPNR